MPAIVLPFSAQMTDKRAALASEITTTLAFHESGWTVTERYELGAERPGGSKAQRDRIMAGGQGLPIKYCRVAQISRGPRGPEDSDVFGAARQVEHVFAVYLWRQFDDTTANQTLWDAITEGYAPNGVLVHLDGLGGVQAGADDEVVYVGQPTDVIIPDEPIHMGDEDFAWLCQFFIVLT